MWTAPSRFGGPGIGKGRSGKSGGSGAGRGGARTTERYSSQEQERRPGGASAVTGGKREAGQEKGAALPPQANPLAPPLATPPAWGPDNGFPTLLGTFQILLKAKPKTGTSGEICGTSHT